MDTIDVMIFIGSDSDLPIMSKAGEVFDGLGIEWRMRITSAHRTSDRTPVLVRDAMNARCKIFICGAGMAAHLAGAVAAQTILPVIGVPLTSESSPLGGMDALLATVQMPPGIPVATMPINGAKNAAWHAAQILALNNEGLYQRLVQARIDMQYEIEFKDEELQSELAQRWLAKNAKKEA